MVTPKKQTHREMGTQSKGSDNSQIAWLPKRNPAVFLLMALLVIVDVGGALKMFIIKEK
jgi:hypothetical protein